MLKKVRKNYPFFLALTCALFLCSCKSEMGSSSSSKIKNPPAPIPSPGPSTGGSSSSSSSSGSAASSVITYRTIPAVVIVGKKESVRIAQAEVPVESYQALAD